MANKLPEQHAFTYSAERQAIPPRRSATREELSARQTAAQQQQRATRTHDYPPANPGRAGFHAGTHPEDAPYSTGQPTTTRKKQPVPIDPDDGAHQEPYRRPTSAIRYPATRGGYPDPKQTRLLRRSGFRPTWLLYAIVSVLVMLVGWQVFSHVGQWWSAQRDDWTYGRPRTFQIDAVVGHNGDSPAHPSHFIALNLNREVIVIELPAGDPAKAILYSGGTLIGDGQDLIPITLSFEDRNHDRKPDLNIHIGDQVIVFLNTGQKFVAPPQH